MRGPAEVIKVSTLFLISVCKHVLKWILSDGFLYNSVVTPGVCWTSTKIHPVRRKSDSRGMLRLAKAQDFHLATDGLSFGRSHPKTIEDPSNFRRLTPRPNENSQAFALPSAVGTQSGLRFVKRPVGNLVYKEVLNPPGSMNSAWVSGSCGTAPVHICIPKKSVYRTTVVLRLPDNRAVRHPLLVPSLAPSNRSRDEPAINT